MSDAINHPRHYNDGKIEVIEFIEDKFLGFHLGNAIKYVARAGRKDPSKTVEDLQKAIWYIRRHISLIAVPRGQIPKPNDLAKAVYEDGMLTHFRCKLPNEIGEGWPPPEQETK